VGPGYVGYFFLFDIL